MKTVMAFGDSILKGVINENGAYHICKNSFVHLCEERLGVKVTNKAKFGSTITAGRAIFDKSEALIAESNSEYVIIEFGGNDCDFDWKAVSENPEESVSVNSSIQTFREYYSYMIGKVKSLGKTPVILSLPPIDAEKYFNWISRNLNKDNILKFLRGNVRFLEEWHERYNLEVFTIAKETGARLIDITSPFLELWNYSDYLCMDGIHPNENGHRLIADTICRAMST